MPESFFTTFFTGHLSTAASEILIEFFIFWWVISLLISIMVYLFLILKRVSRNRSVIVLYTVTRHAKFMLKWLGLKDLQNNATNFPPIILSLRFEPSGMFETKFEKKSDIQGPVFLKNWEAAFQHCEILLILVAIL